VEHEISGSLADFKRLWKRWPNCASPEGPDRFPDEWGDLIRSASPYRGPWPKLSVWHGSADPIVNPRNAEEIVKQWTNVHGYVHQVRGHSRRVWRDETGADLIEVYIISGMGHGVPLALRRRSLRTRGRLSL
jgi:poly(3-hydroxybutyrate) depolymerase